MKRIKIFTTIILLLTLSGCTTEYNLKVNDDYSVEENMIIYENSDYYRLFDNSRRDIVMLKINSDENVKKYDYDIYENVDNFGASLNLKYKNILEYKENNNNFEILFENLKITKENSVVQIHAYDLKNYGPFYQREYSVDKAIISIKLPTKAISSNADEVDEKNHIYKWYITSVLDNADINIKYEENNFVKIINSTYTIIALSIVVLLVLLIFIIKFIKTSKKNNEI